MKARLEIPSRAFILTIAFYETHVFPEIRSRDFRAVHVFRDSLQSLRFTHFHVFSCLQAATFGCNPAERSTAFSCPHTFSQFASNR